MSPEQDKVYFLIVVLKMLNIVQAGEAGMDVIHLYIHILSILQLIIILVV